MPGSTLPPFVRFAALANGATSAVRDLLPRYPTPLAGQQQALGGNRPIYLGISGTLGAGFQLTLEHSWTPVSADFVTVQTFSAVQDVGGAIAGGTPVAITRRYFRVRITGGDGTTAVNVNVIIGSDDIYEFQPLPI